MRKTILSVAVVLAVSAIAFGQGSYEKPPKEIMDVLNAPARPATSISPTRDRLAILEPLRYPPIADLSQPMLRLAGTRVNPNNNAPHLTQYAVKLTLKNVSDGRETAVALPAGAKISNPQWSPDGRWLAYGFPTTLTTTEIRLAHYERAQPEAETADSAPAEPAADAANAEDKPGDKPGDEPQEVPAASPAPGRWSTPVAVTRPVLHDVAPAFDPEGRYLYFLSYREFNPVYDTLHFDLGFPWGMRPYLITLRKDSPEADEDEHDEDDTDGDADEHDEDGGDEGDEPVGDEDAGDEEDGDEDEARDGGGARALMVATRGRGPTTRRARSGD